LELKPNQFTNTKHYRAKCKFPYLQKKLKLEYFYQFIKVSKSAPCRAVNYQFNRCVIEALEKTETLLRPKLSLSTLLATT